MTLWNGSVTNCTGAAAPVRACYGWSEGVWNTATATNVAAHGAFSRDVYADTVNSAGVLRVHLYDDANTNAVLDAGEAFITQTPTVTGAVLEVGFEVSLSTCDKDADGMPDFWEARHGLSWTNAADACGNPDGVGIYAGTYDAIPEPSAAGLLLAGLAVLAMRRRHIWRPGG